ncbi:hypothetical protein [Nostoc sp.]|uniref:hypothetical protein n=1 Tax=Nostoc sp. TaxID=1180 RepID=UPI002FF62AE5
MRSLKFLVGTIHELCLRRFWHNPLGLEPQKIYCVGWGNCAQAVSQSALQVAFEERRPKGASRRVTQPRQAFVGLSERSTQPTIILN